MQDGVVSLSLPAIAPASSGPRTGSDRHRAPVRRASAAAGASSGVFLAGKENALLVSTVESILSHERSPYNPLVVCGLPSSGKSHIAAGLAAQWQAQRPDHVVINITGADFARKFASAIDSDDVDALREEFAAAQLFVLEDLTQLVNKRTAQQELAGLLDVWLPSDTQVVITSKVTPSEIVGFPARLVARLTGGLVLPVSLPESLARVAILQRLAEDRQIAIEPAAVRLLGEQLRGAAPELAGALMELQLAQRVEGASQETITSDDVRKLLARRTSNQPNLRGIAALTAKYFGLKVSDLTSPSRRRAVVTARGVAMYLARELTGKSLEQVGAHFGRRDHTTVLHSYRSTEKRLRADPETRRAIADLRTMLTIT